ncbi:NAD(P)/FAD-dependent oxidoreductase [Peptoniphilus sp.]|jgi:predicted Rossmann fold flavoprotein|uniref:NAD(P)/FAD-dependent oxidoreductase n=1 Tax=Peptoniphilus sp. TaxID=1971214 RepID=UPI003D93D4CD
MKIAIIGGGPSGMMCAIAASENHEIDLYEQNEKLGKKLFISGKGRCNLTNNTDEESFLENVVINKNFLYSAIYTLSPLMTIDMFENFGLKTKTERGNRVFPISDKSSDVIKTYEKILRKNKVNVLLNTKVSSIAKENDKFIINGKTAYDKVVIATGGVSYPLTGSTGDGYKFAKSFGHNVNKTKPALIGIILKNDFNLAGLTLKNIKIKAKVNGKKEFEEFGELLFTHRGISGPTVLSLSSRINKYSSIELSIDLKPALNFEKLDARILRDFDEFKNKNISNALVKLLPKDLITYVLEQAEIPQDKKINQITKEERDSLIKSIKSFKLDFSQFDLIDRAIVTSGGIDVKEIDPSTFESKLVKNLYFIGEVIDVDALTGGYNIQIANSTGYTCGINL